MFSPIAQSKFTIISIIFLALFIVNAFFCQNAILGAILAISFLFFYSKPYGLFALLSAVAIVGSGFYYLADFTKNTAFVVILLAPTIIWLINRRINKKEHQSAKATETKSWLTQTGAAAILILLATVLIILKNSATTEAVASPWSVVPPTVFILFAIAALITVALALRAQQKKLTITLVSLLLLVFLSVSLIVFPIGFGFDSFIHQATEKHIAEFGTITPKPFYYIGQYAIVLFLHHGFFIPIEWADKLLVPILTTLLLPAVWFKAATLFLKEKTAALRSLPALFLLPLSSFIVTTPQGLGNLWFIILLLLAAEKLFDEKKTVWPLIIGTLACLLIHPVAGVPAAIFLTLILLRRFSWIIILFGGLAIPATFTINNLKSGRGWGFDFSSLAPTNLFQNLRFDLFFTNHQTPLLDFVYLFGLNQWLWLTLAVTIGLFWVRKELKPFKINLALAAIILINFVITKAAVDFSFLIDYERGNYAARLIPLFFFTLTPFLMVFAGKFLTSVTKKPFILLLSTIAMTGVIITAAFYWNYPRDNAYEIGHGYNVSQADIAAVEAIEKNTDRANYAVLANQSTSAAAIKQFGFAHYFGEQFYYPIPTGGEFYQSFLEMNKKPSRETALAAMDLIGVNRLYYAVSDYWWQSEKIIEIAKTTTNEWWSVEDEKITIFEYSKN